MKPTQRISAAILLAAIVVAAMSALSVVGREARSIDAVILLVAGFSAGASLTSLLRKK